MSSIMTNTASMAALQTLRSINSEMETTQGRISSGLKVETASDNAAYWSIATTMRSDNKAMSTVSDALGLGSAQVDVAYTGMESVRDVLDEIKSRLVAATQPGVDKAKIQSEITAFQDTIKSIADSANFSGTNWLSVNSEGADYNATQSIVASFSRGEGGAISLGKIDVALEGISLFDSSETGFGLLEGSGNTSLGGMVVGTPTDGTDGVDPADDADDVAAAVSLGDFTAPISLEEGDTISFSIALNGGEATEVTITGAAGGTEIADAAGLRTALTSALSDAGVTGVTVGGTTDEITLSSGTGAGETIAVTGLAATPKNLDILGIDITDATAEQLEAYISGVENALGNVTTAASDLGATKSRIDMQNDFVSNLMDAIDRGIGQLVDADMNEESTRLKALQTQQQLGVQALSIANSESQNILSLFR